MSHNQSMTFLANTALYWHSSYFSIPEQSLLLPISHVLPSNLLHVIVYILYLISHFWLFFSLSAGALNPGPWT